MLAAEQSDVPIVSPAQKFDPSDIRSFGKSGVRTVVSEKSLKQYKEPYDLDA